jgi:hypothetical protein
MGVGWLAMFRYLSRNERLLATDTPASFFAEERTGVHDYGPDTHALFPEHPEMLDLAPLARNEVWLRRLFPEWLAQRVLPDHTISAPCSQSWPDTA